MFICPQKKKRHSTAAAASKIRLHDATFEWNACPSTYLCLGSKVGYGWRIDDLLGSIRRKWWLVWSFLAHLGDWPNMPSTVMPGCIICFYGIKPPQQKKKNNKKQRLTLNVCMAQWPCFFWKIFMKCCITCSYEVINEIPKNKLELNKTETWSKAISLSNKTR